MLLTRKSTGEGAARPRAQSGLLSRSLGGALNSLGAAGMDRRSFLKRSGLGAGAGAFAAQLPFSMIGEARAADEARSADKIEVKRTVCTHCSVGCAVDAVV